MRMFISAAILASALAACDSESADTVAEVATEVAQTVQTIPNCDDVSVQQAVAQQVRESSRRLGERIEMVEVNFDEVLQERDCRMVARYDDYTNLQIQYVISTDSSTGYSVVSVSSIEQGASAEGVERARLASERYNNERRAAEAQRTEVAVTP